MPYFQQKESFILASMSPRRFELLRSLDLRFEVKVADIDEDILPGEKPSEMVKRLAYEKALSVSNDNVDCWVLGADTIVLIDDIVLGKPSCTEEACQMLRKIAGRTHEVLGGISIVKNGHELMSAIDSSQVTISDLSDLDIQRYVETGEPLDKAGAYAVQGIGAHFIKSINGSYTTVVGLNLYTTISLLNRLGLLE